MTEITLNTPDEGSTMTGYYTLKIAEYGDIVAEMHFSPEMVPELEDPSDLRELGEALERVADVAEETEA